MKVALDKSGAGGDLLPMKFEIQALMLSPAWAAIRRRDEERFLRLPCPSSEMAWHLVSIAAKNAYQ